MRGPRFLDDRRQVREPGPRVGEPDVERAAQLRGFLELAADRLERVDQVVDLVRLHRERVDASAVERLWRAMPRLDQVAALGFAELSGERS